MEFEVIKFSKERRNIALLLEEARKKHVIHAFFEADVTKAREIIRKEKSKGRDISFTAWIVKCMAELMKEEKIFNSIRHGSRKIIIFDDVDVAIPVERRIGNETMPVAYILRKVNEKSIDEITKEIRNAQKMELEKGRQVASKTTWVERFAVAAPAPLQKFLLKMLGRNAFIRKKYFGTTAATAVGMFFNGWLSILGGHYTTQIAIGGITKKIVMEGGKPKERDFLRLVISVDHDIIDGAPLARFSSRMADMLKNAAML